MRVDPAHRACYLRRMTLRTCALLFVASALPGCSETCPTARDALNGKVFPVFAHVATWEPADLAGYPSDTSPINGAHDYGIEWATSAPDGEVTVIIDGQSFDGTGRWSESECGNFVVAFDGVYELDGDVHAFSASAELVTWEQHLDGFVDWQETWQAGAGEVGSFAADARLTTDDPLAL